MFDDLRERARTEYEYEDEEPDFTSPLQGILGGLTPQQRFLVSLMLFLDVVVIGCMCLIALGRV